MRFRTAFCQLYILAFVPALLIAQETRGMIFGRVLDPSAAAIPGANVSVRNTETNAVSRVTTNPTGYYEATLLMPGDYEITAQLEGFRTAVRKGVVLPVSSRTQVDFALEIGAVSESIAVTAEAPLVDTSSVSSGWVLDNRQVMDLPMPSNTPTLLVRLTPGLQAVDAVRRIGPESVSSGSDYGLPGGVGGNEWSIDGAPNMGGSRRTAYMPYSDTIQEFKVETANFDASTGYAIGAQVSMISRSGTNSFHGSITNQHRQRTWDAADFFRAQFHFRSIAEAEAAGDKALADQLRKEKLVPSGVNNNYAGTIGGPVRIPKIVNGKDRLFFFLSFNGYKNRNPAAATDLNWTVPTEAERRGDFSQLLGVDAVRYTIYDPLTVRPDPNRKGNYIRDPLTRNILPASRIINPAVQAYFKLMPLPNNMPLDPKAEPTNNYLAVKARNRNDYATLNNRIDYRHSDQHRFFGRWSWNDYFEHRYDWTYDTVPGLNDNGLKRLNKSATVDWVWVPTASTIYNFTASANQFSEWNAAPGATAFNAASVGLPGYIDTAAGDRTILPQMDLAGYALFPRNSFASATDFRMLSAKANVSHIRGSLTMRAGFDTRQSFRTGGGGGYTDGRFRFDNRYTRKYDDTLTPAGSLGHSVAAFLIGLPYSPSIDTNDSYATQSPYYAAYLQTDWRVSPKLTLNLGLRSEYEMGPTERYNRMISKYFDLNATLPITAGAQAAYAASPLPQLPASSFTVRGGTLYPGVNGVTRRLWPNELSWAPRMGAAYQINKKTVLRAGYGFYFDTYNVLDSGPDQTGFSRTTTSVLTTDFGANWLIGDPRNGVSPLKDPFPVRADGTRFDAPIKDALGLMAKTGRGFTFNSGDNYKRARQQRWRAGLQRQLGNNMVIEVAYSGSWSDRIPISRTLDVLPGSYWADGTVRNNTVASDMNQNVSNPYRLSNFSSLSQSNPVLYRELSALSFFTSSTIRKNQLLRPYSHMNGLGVSESSGTVRTHSLETSFEHRFSKGFSVNAGYTRLYAEAADFYFNEFDANPSYRQTNEGRPHRFVATGVWELPMGKGRYLFTQGLLSKLLGGYQVALTYDYQPGQLMSFGNLFYYGDINDIPLEGSDRKLDQWFNTNGFERNASKAPAAFHRRVFPTRVDGVRAASTNIWNANAQREFRIRENLRFQIRMEALNLMNRTQFAGPSTDPLSSDFAKITAESATTKRAFQLQARIRF